MSRPDGTRPGDSDLTTPTTSGGGESINVFDLEVGDCFDVPSDGNITDVEGIPCDEPHDNEVFATFDNAGGPDAPFPGEAAVRQEAESQCAGALFTDYVGVPYNESVFSATSINPTQETWEQIDDREVIGVARRADDSTLTESVQGANRYAADDAPSSPPPGTPWCLVNHARRPGRAWSDQTDRTNRRAGTRPPGPSPTCG